MSNDECKLQGEEGALSLTTKDRSPDAVVKGRPVNYIAGFRPQQTPNSDISNPEGQPYYLLTCLFMPFGQDRYYHS